MRRIGLISAVLLLVVATTPSSAPSRVAGRRAPAAAYLVRGEHVLPVRRVVASAAPARTALAALLAGPTAAERRSGYTSAIPAGTALRGVSLSHRVLTVDLTRRFEAGGGSTSMLLRVAQVVHTATQFPGVARVAIRLDGRLARAVGGEGVVVWPPVGRFAFEDQAPPILVEAPLPGDQVASPLRIRGTADVFEAQFSIDITTAAGRLLFHRDVHAGAGTGTRGSFGLAVPLANAPHALVVVAYDRSPKDGARRDTVRIPVTRR